jgi:hypothetical protein
MLLVVLPIFFFLIQPADQFKSKKGMFATGQRAVACRGP